MGAMSDGTPDRRGRAALQTLQPKAPRIPPIAALLRPWGLPLGLVLVLGLLVGALAYQSPPTGNFAVGWPGDRLFLGASEGLGAAATAQGAFYPDDLTPDSPTGRSRWTRQHARLVLPNLGRGAELNLTLLAQGWPADVVHPPTESIQQRDGIAQPQVVVRVGDAVVGTFVPIARWARYRLTIPVSAHTADDLTVHIITSATFTATLRGADPRPKGLRLAGVEITSAADPLALQRPAWRAVGLLMLAALLLYLLLLWLLRAASVSFFLTALGTGLAGMGLALARIWMGAALSVALGLLGIGLLGVLQRPVLRGVRRLLARYSQGHALHYGLVVAALAWLVYLLGRGVSALRSSQPDLELVWSTFPDSLLVGLLGVGLLALGLVLGRDGLPRVATGIASLLNGPRAAPLLLLLFGGIWLSYEALVSLHLPYVGHADYADNAVVARNLVAGRGWVVDYVTQFYRIYPDTTHPQETWPLLQPVWIAPFLGLFGPEAWAARLPNLCFNVLLVLLIYEIGTHIWDRRVGLTAALLVLTNHLFFNLAIYTTSDLAFVVFALAAVYLLYRAVEAEASGDPEASPPPLAFFAWSIPFPLLFLAASGGLTGLMMLQKPSGATVAVGMGLWLLGSSLLARRGLMGTAWRFGFWAGLALLVLSPYLVRNMLLFDGAPVYSTESYDAWVLGYRGTSGEAWQDIYRVFVPELGGPGLPDRSWVLRWGFDRTFAKLATQLDALRDYLMPAWSGQPGLLVAEDGRPYLFSRDAEKNLLTPVGTWLALLGLLGALQWRRRLLGLLLLASAPYTLFLLTYWRTNEERYFLLLLPWLALLAAWAIWGSYTRIAAIGDRRWSPLALILVGAALVSIVQPSWPRIADKVQAEPARWAPDIAAYEWLRTNTPPDAVMMTRNPWQLNWHAERPAVMIPNTNDPAIFCWLARHYRAEYLVFETLQRVKGDAARLLAPLLDARTAQPGAVIDGFTLVYASPTPDNRVLIYQFPPPSSPGPPGPPDSSSPEEPALCIS